MKDVTCWLLARVAGLEVQGPSPPPQWVTWTNLVTNTQSSPSRYPHSCDFMHESSWKTPSSVTNIYFPISIQIHLPFIDACVRADATSGARQTARVAAVSALSDCVEIRTRFCWRVNCGKSARAARSARAASRKCCALIGWPACRWEYKTTSNQYVRSLVGGGLGRRHDRLGAWQLKC